MDVLSTTKIKKWMETNIQESIEFEESNATKLAEDFCWNSGLAEEEWLDQADHIVWEVAMDVSEAYNESQMEN